MSAFTDVDGPIPDELRTAEFVLRPITAEDTEKDYAAVMEARQHLRLWEQSTWPADDFTVEDNRTDVVDMATRHAARRAFSYTVLDPQGDECLGCVYLFPTSATFLTKARVTAIAGAAWADVEVVAYFWVRASRMATGMDERLLSALRAWLTEVWGFTGAVYVTSETFAQQVALLEGAGLTPRFEIREPGKPARNLAFG